MEWRELLDIDHEDTGDEGSTALMHASVLGYVDIVNALLDRGAEIDKVDDNGWTALMKACFSPYPLVVKTLIQRGADTEHLDLAQENCFSVLGMDEEKYYEWADWFYGEDEDYVRDPDGYPDAEEFPQDADYIDTVVLFFEASKVRKDFLMRRFAYASLLVRWMLRTLRSLYAPPDPKISGHRGGVLYRRSVDEHTKSQGLFV